MNTTSTDLTRKVEAESVANDDRFITLMEAAYWTHVENYVNGGSEVLFAQRETAKANFIAHIDSIITARVAAAEAKGSDNLRQSIDRMLRDTINAGDEPLSLAQMIWTIRECLAASQAAPAKAEGKLLQAVERLIKAKGRFHTEQNYAALVAAYDESVAAPSIKAKEPT